MKGPKDGIICASVREQRLARDFARTQHCCLAISVGQDYHEGVKLETAIHFIDKTFAKCTIALGDTLQRHNMMDAGNPYQAALEAGDAWLDRNKSIFKRFSIPYEIYRWDRWLSQQAFHAYYSQLKSSYEHDLNFRAGFSKTITVFSERLKKRCPDVDISILEEHSLNFLLEESAIIMLMWQQEQFHYIAYPGEMIPALEVTREKFLGPKKFDMLSWLPLQFKRYSLEYLLSLSTERQTIFPGHQFYDPTYTAKAA